MSTNKASHYFLRLRQKYQLLRITEILLWSVAIGLVGYFTLKFLQVNSFGALSVACALVICAAVIGSRRLHVFNIQETELALYINRQYPQLEESADLLLQEDHSLTSLQQLQKRKTIKRFEIIYPAIKLPHHIGKALKIFGLSVIICAALTAFSIRQKEKSLTSEPTDKLPPIAKNYLPVFIKKATITFSPPSYTRLKRQTSEDFNLKIPEGSMVQWEITFDDNVIASSLILSGSDSIALSYQEKNSYHISRSFRESGFYQISWTASDSSIQYSDFYKIEVIKDYPPSITVENQNQFVELSLTDTLKIKVNAVLSDDYGLSNGYIIATVSKGSGEAIKFREEKLNFDTPKKVSGKNVKAKRSIDLVKLGLQPGDELYFYIEASDIKSPVPNRTRTETYFVSLRDTSSLTTSVDAGLGVDLMPEYFRSQRQIIIDSEKLLRQKKHISKQNFNERSNELGYDQKVLRLRYGEFLGEEFTTSIGPQAEIPNDERNHEEEDVTKKFGHAHDTENEHNLVEDKRTPEEGHAHDHTNPADGNQKTDPIKEFVHAHDSEEEATFFVQSIKAKLKAAVTIMWDAELYLRLYQPEKSLPYQYKALKLLKEISQDSRIYVHRTGFDPPPLKEEKRLTGDLSEIKSTTLKDQKEKADQYPHIRNALKDVEELLQKDSILLSTEIQNNLIKAGQELATIALKQPGRNLKSLSLLKNITQNEIQGGERIKALTEIRAAFWNVLPQETISPQSRPNTRHNLDLLFLENLEASKQNN